MTNSDWHQAEQQNGTLPTIVSSTDLFDGDLFGEELMDIYNAAISNASDTGNEIPILLTPCPENDDKEDHSDDHPGAQVAMTAAAIDDGLGAFRPSTSFNDLTLLPPAVAASVDNASGAQAAVAPTAEAGQKRAAAPAEQAGPPSKKRATAAKRNVAPAPRRASGTKPTVTETAKPVTKTDANTPNPLSVGATAAVPRQQAVASKPEAVASAPTVVSPRNAPTTVKVEAVSEPTAPAPAATEADFKSVAQAAVSNLIMNAGTASKAETPKDGEGKVDTSTAHIKALTGSNWVAACTGGSGATTVNESKANNRARRQNLTPDERARQNRDRNREHARNTRLRKKAYVEELKRTLTELVAQRDSAELEKRHAAQREVEQREVRFRVIEEFLKLRGRNETNFARWAAILEDGFCLTLPCTNFRKMVNEPKDLNEQVLSGVSEVMTDSSHLAAFIQSFSGKVGPQSEVTLTYHCDRSNFLMDGCNAILDWTASTSGAVAQGATSELSLKGTLRAQFSPASNKMLSASMGFDTGSVFSQTHHHKVLNETCDDIAAAAAAACEADAILDSLQMPHLSGPVPSAVNVVPSSAHSVSSDSKGSSSDEDEDMNIAQENHGIKVE